MEKFFMTDEGPAVCNIKHTLCAGCDYMWDGFGEACPTSKIDMIECNGYKPITDERKEDQHAFWDNTFIHHVLSDEECEEHEWDYMFMFQPIRPLLLPVQLEIQF